MKRRLSPILMAGVLLLSLSAPVQAYDDTKGHWASQAIEKAKAYHLMVGYDDGRFGVSDYLNRASFVTILCRMFGWAPQTGAPSFNDTGGHWAAGYIEAARAHNVLGAYRSFRPDDPISREEMSIMLVRALGYQSLAESLDGAPTPFADVTRNQGYLSFAYRTGIISGVHEGGRLLFKPSVSATRAEAAVMLTQVYERHISKVDWLHGFYAFSSYSQISLTQAMDGVSVGWAQMELGPDGPWLNSTSANGNDWVLPQNPQPALDYFRNNGTPYHLSVFGSAADSTDPAASTVGQIVTSPDRRRQAVAALVEAAGDYDGLTIDFEGLKSPLKEGFSTFMAELRAALPANKTLYVCVQPTTWYGGFDFRALGRVCDKVILMAHDYRPPVSELKVGSVPSEAFAVTHISHIYTALCQITDPDTGVEDREKIALALSMDTTGFKIDGSGAVAEAKYYRPPIAELAQRLAQPDTAITYSDTARNPCAVYTGEDGGRYQVWYEDGRSARDKIHLARLFGINGLSIWRLGNIPNYDSYDLWSAVLAERP